MLTATENYLADEDTFARWLDECCLTGRHRWGNGNLLWSSWKAWSERNNERTGSRKAFAQAIIERGFNPSKSQDIRGYDGIELRPERDERADLR